jgi:hypothetical protein
MTDGRHPHALFDPDDLDDFDWDFTNQWYHAVLALLSMGPAYLLCFIMSPLLLGLTILGILYWTGRGTYWVLRRIKGAFLIALGIILRTLRASVHLVQRFLHSMRRMGGI